ncbi:MAG: hypothetical protein AAF411_25825, partial [Myxococcota bacterium]
RTNSPDSPSAFVPDAEPMHRQIFVLASQMTVVMLVACEARQVATSPEASSGGEATGVAAASDEPRGDSSVPDAETADNRTVVPPSAGADAQADAERERLARALEAGSNPPGDTDCERAYNGMLAMVAALGDDGHDDGGAPPRHEFVASCSQLPEEAQRCMVLDYGMAHQERCAQVMQSPEVDSFRRQFQ